MLTATFAYDCHVVASRVWDDHFHLLFWGSGLSARGPRRTKSADSRRRLQTSTNNPGDHARVSEHTWEGRQQSSRGKSCDRRLCWAFSVHDSGTAACVHVDLYRYMSPAIRQGPESRDRRCSLSHSAFAESTKTGLSKSLVNALEPFAGQPGRPC